MARPQAELGVFGGSGFYAFLDGVEEHKVETPYGAPSDKVAIGEVEGRKVAFLPRHGRRHQYPPHKIPYRANLWAMKELGVSRVIGPCAAGSLQAEAAPGHFVICDQVVDRTWGRDDTFYDGPETTHISFADPYCPELRSLALKEAEAQGITAHDGGTMVVIQGPRFSTRAESKWFQGNGWKVINMTGYPEALLARELELCYVNVSLITDYDVGLEGLPGVQPVSHSEVVRVFAGEQRQAQGPPVRPAAERARGPHLPVRHRPQGRPLRGLTERLRPRAPRHRPRDRAGDHRVPADLVVGSPVDRAPAARLRHPDPGLRGPAAFRDPGRGGRLLRQGPVGVRALPGRAGPARPGGGRHPAAAAGAARPGLGAGGGGRVRCSRTGPTSRRPGPCGPRSGWC